MSGVFVDQIRRIAAMLPVQRLSDDELAAIEVVRMLAAEYVEAARTGPLPVDGLMCAVTLAGKSGKHNECVMRGFLQDLQKALAGDR
ncbi:hypothetical protein ACWKW4_08060 [Hydrogenophaga borbori]